MGRYLVQVHANNAWLTVWALDSLADAWGEMESLHDQHRLTYRVQDNRDGATVGIASIA